MNRKHAYKDLKKFAETKKAYQERWRKRSGAGKYGRRRWTLEEDDIVLGKETTDREISKKIHRSIGAIQIRRVFLKKKMEGDHGT